MMSTNRAAATPRSFEVTIRDGRRVLIRPVRPVDSEPLATLRVALSGQSGGRASGIAPAGVPTGTDAPPDRSFDRSARGTPHRRAAGTRATVADGPQRRLNTLRPELLGTSGAAERPRPLPRIPSARGDGA